VACLIQYVDVVVADESNIEQKIWVHDLPELGDHADWDQQWAHNRLLRCVAPRVESLDGISKGCVARRKDGSIVDKGRGKPGQP
jgi:hypothetical protein